MLELFRALQCQTYGTCPYLVLFLDAIHMRSETILALLVKFRTSYQDLRRIGMERAHSWFHEFGIFRIAINARNAFTNDIVPLAHYQSRPFESGQWPSCCGRLEKLFEKVDGVDLLRYFGPGLSLKVYVESV